MKKKVLTIFLALLTISVSAFIFSSCKHEHSYFTKVIEPTCTEQGYTVYTCKCGEFYNYDYVNALGHNCTISYMWENDKCTASKICLRESLLLETESVTANFIKDTDATCTTAEKGHYVAEFSNTAFETQTTLSGSIEKGEKLGHNYSQPTYEWKDNKCTAKAVCLNDDSHQLIETVTAIYVKDADATCTTAEKGHFVASFENIIFKGQATLTNSISVGNPLGHSFTNYVYNDDAIGETNGTATAICDRESCNQTDTINVCSIRATFEVNDIEFDINTPIVMGDIVLINAYVDEKLQTENIEYKVIKLDSDRANSYEFTITNNRFVAGLVGNYEICVYYKDGGVTYSTKKYNLTVVANKNISKYIETFSDSSSVLAVYKVGYNQTNYSDYKNNYEIYAESTTWLNEFKGRYGVIKTKPQNDYINACWGGARLGIHLRSTEYRTLIEMSRARITNTVYGMGYKPIKGQGRYCTYNCDSWDYISIPIYLPKANAKIDETIKISTISLTQQFEVPYNTWYELKLDKISMLDLFAGDEGYILNQYIGNTIESTPTFYLGYDDVTAQANINQEVYIDSISFEKYKEYERFDEVYFYSDFNKQIVPPSSLLNLKYVVDEYGKFPINFILNAKVEGYDINYKNIKIKYLSLTSSLYFKCYNADNIEVYTQNGYDIDENNGICKVAITGYVGELDYIKFCFTYEDGKTGRKYLCHRMLSFLV